VNDPLKSTVCANWAF